MQRLGMSSLSDIHIDVIQMRVPNVLASLIIPFVDIPECSPIMSHSKYPLPFWYFEMFRIIYTPNISLSLWDPNHMI